MNTEPKACEDRPDALVFCEPSCKSPAAFLQGTFLLEKRKRLLCLDRRKRDARSGVFQPHRAVGLRPERQAAAARQEEMWKRPLCLDRRKRDARSGVFQPHRAVGLRPERQAAATGQKEKRKCPKAEAKLNARRPVATLS